MATEGQYPNLWAAVDCDSSQLGTANFAECSELVTQHESQVHGVLMCDLDPLDPNAPVTAAGTDLLTWEAAIDNAVVGKWKLFDVIGDIPEPEQDSRIISKNRVKRGPMKHTINFDVDDTTQENYDMLIQLQAYPEKIIYYFDKDNLYGPIKAQIVKAVAPKNRGEGSYDAFLYAAEWVHDHNPPRAASPFII